jgi:hypothetical protein
MKYAARGKRRPKRQKGPKPIAQIPAQTAYLNLVESYPVRKGRMVRTTGIEFVTLTMSTER